MNQKRFEEYERKLERLMRENKVAHLTHCPVCHESIVYTEYTHSIDEDDTEHTKWYKHCPECQWESEAFWL